MKRIFIYTLSIICFLVCSLKLIVHYTLVIRTPIKYTQLSNSKTESILMYDTTTDSQQKMTLSELSQMNSDFIGWLRIENTGIDYPVVQTSNNVHYLTHDFWNHYSPAGVPFMDFETPLSSDNIIIYGHNMKNGTMFSNLVQFKNEDFYKEHPVIKFETLESSKSYKIVSILLIDVANLQGLTFTEFTDLDAKREFINLIKTQSLIHINESITENDRFLTLCTCDQNRNNRLLVIAKELP